MPSPKIVIIGGVAGGASAAARARRLSEAAEIILVERGPDISFANCGMPYHIGGDILERTRLLVQTPAAMSRRFNLDVRTRMEALMIDRERKCVSLRCLKTGTEIEESYDFLVLSPGAEPVKPALPGIELPQVFTLRTLGDMDRIKQVVDENRSGRAVVVGGGYIGLEMAEALHKRGIKVMLVEMAGQVMNPLDPEMAMPLHQHLQLQGVELRLNQSVTGFFEQAGSLHVRLSTGEALPCALALVAVGVKPETRLAKSAGLTLGARGGIAVDEHMRTSDPAIYAVGDAVETEDLSGGFSAVVPLAGLANRQGRIAADHIMGRGSRYCKTQGTAICKVFDLAAAMTGPNEKTLKRLGRAYEKIYVHPASHAGYYPGAYPISLKLLFDPGDGRLLGAQAVGADGVDKRIDVLAVAMRAGMTVFDLENLELAYAPPYSSAKDPVNIAGFVAANALRGDVRLVHAEEAANPSAYQKLLDVRTRGEMAAGTIPGAINIPLNELRQRIGELPKDKEWLVFCQVGQRAYMACRILSQAGYACRNLSGGYATYKAVTGHGYTAEKDLKETRDDATPALPG